MGTRLQKVEMFEGFSAEDLARMAKAEALLAKLQGLKPCDRKQVQRLIQKLAMLTSDCLTKQSYDYRSGLFMAKLANNRWLGSLPRTKQQEVLELLRGQAWE